MSTVPALLARLLGSVVDLVTIFVGEVALRDPLTALVFAVGAAITTVAAVAFGVLTVGGLVAGLRR